MAPLINQHKMFSSGISWWESSFVSCNPLRVFFHLSSSANVRLRTFVRPVIQATRAILAVSVKGPVMYRSAFPAPGTTSCSLSLFQWEKSEPSDKYCKRIPRGPSRLPGGASGDDVRPVAAIAPSTRTPNFISIIC